MEAWDPVPHETTPASPPQKPAKAGDKAASRR
jgi:hypothetical protein